MLIVVKNAAYGNTVAGLLAKSCCMVRFVVSAVPVVMAKSVKTTFSGALHVVGLPVPAAPLALSVTSAFATSETYILTLYVCREPLKKSVPVLGVAAIKIPS